MLAQRSIRSVTQATGVGLHSGEPVELTLRPAPPNSGIVFCRTDLARPVSIRSGAAKVRDTRLATTLEQDGAHVRTIEHLLSACCGLGIDNLQIDLNAEELPILDGSAASFVFLLQSAGITEQPEAPKRFIRVKRTVRFQDTAQDKWASLEPYDGLKLEFQIGFDHPAVSSTRQQVSFDFSSGAYGREIARARTFGFTRDVEAMLSRGLARGGGMDNAIVMDDARVLNAGPLRYDDEFVKHKILDAIGDLYADGRPLLASYRALRAGHAINNQLLRALLEQPDAWEEVSFRAESAPAGFAPDPLW